MSAARPDSVRQDDPVALSHHVQLHKHEPCASDGARPLRTSGLEGGGCVEHQADAPYTVKHLVDARWACPGLPDTLLSDSGIPLLEF